MTVVLDPMPTSPSHIADVAATLAPAQPLVWERDGNTQRADFCGYLLTAGTYQQGSKRLGWAAVDRIPTGSTLFREGFRDLRHAKHRAVRVALLRFVTRAMK